MIIAGGLQMDDPDAGVVVVPGCCAGLEDWRDWALVLTGGSPWLGHDPGPKVDVLGENLRVWQDGGPDRDRSRWSGHHVDFRRHVLCREMLMGVQRDLVGFLDAVAGWAERAGLGLRGTALVTSVDQNFVITVPWDLGDGSPAVRFMPWWSGTRWRRDRRGVRRSLPPDSVPGPRHR